jgi:hypothetical protein
MRLSKLLGANWRVARMLPAHFFLRSLVVLAFRRHGLMLDPPNEERQMRKPRNFREGVAAFLLLLCSTAYADDGMIHPVCDDTKTPRCWVPHETSEPRTRLVPVARVPPPVARYPTPYNYRPIFPNFFRAW